MNYIHHFISEELIYALGWTVIHSIWQALLVALLVTAMMLGIKKQSAQHRYMAYYMGLLSVLFLAAMTFLDLYQWGHQSTVQSVIFINDMTIVEFQNAAKEAGITNFLIDYFNQNMPLIVLLWLTGMAFFTLRLAGGFAFIQYLRQHYHYTVPPRLEEQLWDLMDKIPLDKTVQLAESALVKVPMVIGFFKPIILLPLGTINQLAPQEMEAILAHELAHIARNDYLLNVLQSVIEVLFYYNPAVWWLSANIRLERENCCDDIAVALCGNSLTYAKALVSLQAINHTPPILAMPFTGNKNQLLHRIQRILKQPQNRNNIMEKVIATCLLIGTIGLFSFTAQSNDSYEGETDFSTEISIDNFTEKEITVTVQTDTIPKSHSNHTERVTYDSGDSRVELERLNGEMQSLKIDGETIPESEWEEYADEIDALPPPPPMRPEAPVPPTPPSSTTRTIHTKTGETRVITVTPISPTTPSCDKSKCKSKCKSKTKAKRKTIRTQEGEAGSTLIIIENHNGEDPTRIQIDEGEAVVKVDGRKIPLNKALTMDGDEVHIIGRAMIFDDNDFDFPDMDNSLFEWSEENDAIFRQSMQKLAEQQELFGHSWSEEQEEEMEHFYEERQEMLVEQQERAEELRVEAQERFQQMQREQREHSLGQQELAEQLREESEERMQLLQEEYRDKMEALRVEAEELAAEQRYEMEYQKELLDHNFDSNLNQILASALYADGLIEHQNRFRFKLTTKELKINGVIAPAHLRAKYIALYEKLNQSKLNDNSVVNIRYRSIGKEL